MTYQEFKDTIKAKKHMPDYYSQLIEHTPDILDDIMLRNQGVVARDLNMAPTKLSHILPILKEVYKCYYTQQR